MGLQIAKLKGARLVMGRPPTPSAASGWRSSAPILPSTPRSRNGRRRCWRRPTSKGVDLIVDQVSASVANQNLKAAAVLGRIVNVGRLGGFKGEFDFDLHARSASTTSASPSARAASRRCARSTAACARTCGAPSRKASCACRSTRPFRWRRPRRRWRTCAPTPTSARSCWWCEAREDCGEREPDNGRHPGAARARQRAAGQAGNQARNDASGWVDWVPAFLRTHASHACGAGMTRELADALVTLPTQRAAGDAAGAVGAVLSPAAGGRGGVGRARARCAGRDHGPGRHGGRCRRQQGFFAYAFSRIAARVEAFEPNPDYAAFARAMLGIPRPRARGRALEQERHGAVRGARLRSRGWRCTWAAA